MAMIPKQKNSIECPLSHLKARERIDQKVYFRQHAYFFLKSRTIETRDDKCKSCLNVSAFVCGCHLFSKGKKKNFTGH